MSLGSMLWAMFMLCVVFAVLFGGIYLIRRLLRMDGPTKRDRQQEEQFKLILDRELAMMKSKKNSKPTNRVNK